MSENKINWKKGFFRIWIVVSLIWVISLSVLIKNKYNEIDKDNKNIYANLELILLHYDIYVNKLFPTLKTRDAIWDRYNLLNAIQLLEFREKNKISTSKDEADLNDDLLFIYVKLEKNDKLKNEMIYYYVLIIVIPITMLLIGIGIIWIRKGFN